MSFVTKHAMAAVAIGLCAAFANAAHAENQFASQRIELREACLEQGGVFRRMWAYNDQGVRWGETLSCATKTGTITCRGGVCRTGTMSRPNGTKTFPAETHAFSAMLSALNAN